MRCYLFILLLLMCFSANAQQNRADSNFIPLKDSVSLFDSAKKNPSAQPVALRPDLNAVSPKKKQHDPRKATRLSLIFPGLGQIYNREPWWRIGLVYAAVGIPTYFFIDNNIWYNKTKKAYEIRVNNDSARFGEIDDILKPLNTASLQFYRNEFRRNRDYSALFILLAWGLNIVDATVYAHLKEFDINDDLSFKMKPDINPSTGNVGATLTFSLKQNKTARDFSFLHN